jgi:hypothetical protein
MAICLSVTIRIRLCSATKPSVEVFVEVLRAWYSHPSLWKEGKSFWGLHFKSLAHSVNGFTDVIHTLAPSGPDTLHRRQEAVWQTQSALMLEKAWFTQRQFLSLIKVLQKDNEIYMVLDDDIWKEWTRDELGIEQPIP